ncbi:MAG: hypothetical protein Q9209_003560 [Squamulea sp. 1 TL-2023]
MQHVRKLADITAIPFGSNARIQSSEVVSLNGENRKKRSEIALAVDGYGLEIRDVRFARSFYVWIVFSDRRQVRSGSAVAVYSRSLAAASTFTCPPCSIKLGTASSKDAQIITYCSVEDPRPKLLRFSNETQKGVRQSIQQDAKEIDLAGPETRIVHIEAVAILQGNTESSTIDIICIHQDGQISCYDEALTQKKWGPQKFLVRDGDQPSGNLQVVQVSSMSVLQARKTFLKYRSDVCSMLDAKNGTFAPHFLLLLSRPTPSSDRTGQRQPMLHMLALMIPQTKVSKAIQPSEKKAQEILSLGIPESKPLRNKNTLFRIHTASGTLYQGTGRHLSIYDLNALTPRLVHNISFEGQHDALSYITISPGILATLSNNSISVMDFQYTSCRAKYQLTVPKESPESEPRDAQLLTYHGPSASAIVLFGRKLLAVDLSASIELTPSSRKRKRNGLLVDVIGRGSLSAKTKQRSSKRMAASSVALGNLMELHHETAEWEQTEMKLNAALARGDRYDFDEILLPRLGISNGQPDNNTPAMRTPQYIVDYVLGQLFSTSPRKSIACWNDQKGREVGIESFFDQAWQCLVRRGLVSTERVELSLRRRGLLSSSDDLRDGELVEAVTHWDESLAMLQKLLHSPCLIRMSEVCQALKIVIARFATAAAPNGFKLLNFGDEPLGLNDNPAEDMDLAKSGSNILPQLSCSDSDHLYTLFDVILARCDACPASAVTKSFKAHLSISELQTFVILLRTKLRQEGWLSSHTEDEFTVNFRHPCSNRNISMIGKLLNCALDSLGTGGWLLNNSLVEDATVVVETVSNMQAEISTALEGIWEANYLQGLLEGLLSCGKGALSSQTASVQPTLEWQDNSKTALPLGLKLEQSISRIKVGAGGELQRRSRRDIGKLKSRRVPVYSFEQIAI